MTIISFKAWAETLPNVLKDNVLQVKDKSNTFLYDLNNPLNKYVYYGNTLYETSAYYNWDNDREIYIPALGSGEKNGGVDVNLIHLLSKNAKFYARANYQNTTTRKVVLNEIEDYLNLYPYILMDSLGGNLNGERYSFLLGYMHSLNKFVLGAEFGYKASHSYRTKDPRPRNITSDLHLKLLGGYNLPNYSLGLDINYGRYSQTSSVDLYSVLGGAKQYHYLGLGTMSDRFSSKSQASFIRSDKLGVNINLIPNTAYGFSASLGYTKENLEKILSDLRNLPLNDLSKSSVEINGAYKHLIGKYDLGIKANFLMHERIGTEKAFGTEGNSYPLLSSSEAFKMNFSQIVVQLLISRDFSQRINIGLKPEVEFFSNKMSRYEDKIEWNNISLGGELFFTYQRNKFWGTASFMSKYRQNSTNEAQHNLKEAVFANFTPMLESHIQSSAKFDLYFQISEYLALNCMTGVNIEKYPSYSKYVQVFHSLGIIF